MAGPQHRTPEFRAAYRNLKRANQLGELICVQPICLEPTRVIARRAPMDVAHNDAGTVILGPAHRSCNRTDGGYLRWHPPSPPDRHWVL